MSISTSCTSSTSSVSASASASSSLSSSSSSSCSSSSSDDSLSASSFLSDDSPLVFSRWVLSRFSDSDLSRLFTECLLVVPCVSFGNLPQLAMDALIIRLNCEKIGSLHSSCIVPFVGVNALKVTESKAAPNANEQVAAAAQRKKMIRNSGQATESSASSSSVDSSGERVDGLTVSLELFYCTQLKAIFLQQRSPIISGQNLEFSSGLIQFCCVRKIPNVVLLSSSASHALSDSQLMQALIHQPIAIGGIRYFFENDRQQNTLSDAQKRFEDIAKRMDFKRIPVDQLSADKTSLHSKSDQMTHSALQQQWQWQWWGSGNIRHLALVNRLLSEVSPPLHGTHVTGLLAYTSEGDNTFHALQFAHVIQQILCHIQQPQSYAVRSDVHAHDFLSGGAEFGVENPKATSESESHDDAHAQAQAQANAWNDLLNGFEARDWCVPDVWRSVYGPEPEQSIYL